MRGEIPSSAGRSVRANPYRISDVIADKYCLVRTLGSGGMGTVWEAVNTSIGLPVALKICSAGESGPAIKARLKREAQVAAMLAHNAIVRVFDYGESFFGDPYLVMELLEGESLGAMLERETCLEPKLAVQLLLPIASGVHAANMRGIVHRDLKPDNIVIARNDAGAARPMIVDFGVAMIRWLDMDESFAPAAVVGTPEYMAPEQALALDDVDHRVDVWALCALLYESISGRTPFGRSGLVDTLVAVERPLPSLVASCGIDEVLWYIIAKGLERDPRDRWNNTHELGRALASWLLALGIAEDACGTSLRSHWMPEATPSGQPATSRRLLPTTPPQCREAAAIPLVSHATRELFGLPRQASGSK